MNAMSALMDMNYLVIILNVLFAILQLTFFRIIYAIQKYLIV